MRPVIKTPQHDSTPSVSRGLFLGVSGVLLINGYTHYIRHVIRAGELAIAHFPFLLFAGFLLLVFVIRPLLLKVAPKFAPRRQDFVSALIVGFVGTAIPPLVTRFVATISAPYYYATPENRWAEFTFPFLPGWLFPTDEAGQIRAFYQGMEGRADVPWGAWIAPLAWWFGLIVAMLLGCIFLGVLLRAQWVDRERLAFPHVQVSLPLTEDPKPGRLLPEGLRSRLFLAGVLIAFIPHAWNVLGYFSPGLPLFEFVRGYPRMTPMRGFPDVFTKFDFYVIGFAYFTPLEILFSIWFFHLLMVFQVGISSRIGFGPSSDAGVNWQTAGAMFAWVLWGIWMARDHLRLAWRKAWRDDPSVDDSGELVSYRVAVLGGLTCLLFVFGWLMCAGMTPEIALLFMFVYLVMSLGVAKIVAMAGLISLRWTWTPNAIVVGALGSTGMGMRNFAVLGFVEAIHTIWKGFALPASCDAARLGDELEEGHRRVGGWTIAAGIVALFICVGTLVQLGYVEGAENFGDYRFTTSNRFTYNMIAGAVLEPVEPKAEEMGFFGSGMVLASVVTYMMYRYPWWPLHPLGFTVAFSWPIRASAFSIFIAWAVKALVLRIGGIRMYTKGQQVFLGILTGYALAVVFSALVDGIAFLGQGHTIHSPPM